MGYQATSEEYVAPPQIEADTIHTARLVSIEPKEISWPDKENPGQRLSRTLLKWKWEIVDGEYAGKWVWGECDARLSSHPKNQFRNWSETLLNREIPTGMSVDTDDLTGLQARVIIEHQQDKKDPEKIYVKVGDLLPNDGDDFRIGDEPPF